MFSIKKIYKINKHTKFQINCGNFVAIMDDMKKKNLNFTF